MFNICQCGAMSGYPHTEDCPYPYFFQDEKGVAKWEADHASKVFEMVNGFSPEAVRFARENEFWDLVDDKGNPVELPAVFEESNEAIQHGVAPDSGKTPASEPAQIEMFDPGNGRLKHCEWCGATNYESNQSCTVCKRDF